MAFAEPFFQVCAGTSILGRESRCLPQRAATRDRSASFNLMLAERTLSPMLHRPSNAIVQITPERGAGDAADVFRRLAVVPVEGEAEGEREEGAIDPGLDDEEPDERQRLARIRSAIPLRGL